MKTGKIQMLPASTTNGSSKQRRASRDKPEFSNLCNDSPPLTHHHNTQSDSEPRHRPRPRYIDESTRFTEYRQAKATIDTRESMLQLKLARIATDILQISKELGDRKTTDTHQSSLRDISMNVKALNLSHCTDLDDKEHIGNVARIKFLEEKIKKVVEEKTQLSNELREVSAMNTRWQLYNNQREDYVIKQSVQIAALMKRVRGSSSDDPLKGLADQNDETSKETIQALEYQVKTNQEDFALERLDRARIQGSLEELKDKLEKVERVKKQQDDLIFVYQEQLGALRRGVDELDFRHLNKPRYNNWRRELVSNVEVDCIDHVEEEVGSNIGENSMKEKSGEFSSLLSNDDVNVNAVAEGDEVDGHITELQCPKCYQSFAYSDHARLIDHFNGCLT